MQLMPSTGAYFKARNLYDPAQNLRAGAEHIRFVDREWREIEDRSMRLRFILASYNVGSLRPCSRRPEARVEIWSETQRLGRKRGKISRAEIATPLLQRSRNELRLLQRPGRRALHPQHPRPLPPLPGGHSEMRKGCPGISPEQPPVQQSGASLSPFI